MYSFPSFKNTYSGICSIIRIFPGPQMTWQEVGRKIVFRNKEQHLKDWGKGIKVCVGARAGETETPPVRESVKMRKRGRMWHNCFDREERRWFISFHIWPQNDSTAWTALWISWVEIKRMHTMNHEHGQTVFQLAVHNLQDVYGT